MCLSVECFIACFELASSSLILGCGGIEIPNGNIQFVANRNQEPGVSLARLVSYLMMGPLFLCRLGGELVSRGQRVPLQR